MIISIYGIPRAGKDYFITKILDKRKDSIHIKGSKTLDKISIERFGCKFKEISDDLQKEVRVLFTEYVKKFDKGERLVIVDGHYSFPKDNTFLSVFTKEDLDLYDVFYYLKRTTNEIKRNFDSGGKKEYREILLSPERVHNWMEYEISNMKKEVESYEKDFIVLDSDEEAVDFVCNFKETTKNIAKQIANEILLTGNKNIILTDLDKTVSIEDLTNDFINYSHLDPFYPKKIFKGDYYSSYQFYKFHQYLIGSMNYDLSIKYAISKLTINCNLINDFCRMKKENGLIVAITTGIKDAWVIKNKEMHIFDKIYGFDNSNKLIVTPLLKTLVAKYLSKKSNVISIGDSIIDLGMILEAKKGFLISTKKLDARIIKVFKENDIKAEIYQPSYSLYKYDFLKEAKIKW